MRGYLAFLKKEWMENTRTYKLFIMILVFFIFGIMSPLMAKLLPNILKGMEIDGMIITIPEPSAIDSYTQYFKNITQMGLIVLLIVFSGILSNEISKGTLINMLTKGLSRCCVILAKYTIASVIWTLSLILSFLTTLGYTIYFFPEDKVVNLLLSVFCLWLFGQFLLSILMFSSTLMKNNYGSLLSSALMIAMLFIINIIPDVSKYNPIALAANNVSMLERSYNLDNIYKSMFVTIVAIIGMLLLSLKVFQKKLL